MKRLLSIIVLICVLSGCSAGSSAMDRAMQIRQKLLDSNGCSFDAVITADYGDSLHVFSMQCTADDVGNLTFTVTNPETIEGISGKVREDGGQIVFNETVLAFPLLAEGEVTPVSAPWLFTRTLKGGYLSGCSQTEDVMQLQIHDSYMEDSLLMDIYIDADDLPVRCEIVWQGRRILSLDIRNFQYL